MKRQDYRQRIHKLFEEARSKRKIESTLDILMLHMYERQEKELLEENSLKALSKTLDIFHK